MPGPTFRFVKLLASSVSHCTKWADEQHRQAGFESRLVPDLPLPFILTLIGLRAFDLVSSRVWWEAATNIGRLALVQRRSICSLPLFQQHGVCILTTSQGRHGESNQSQLWTQYNQQITATLLIQTDLLRANLRKSTIQQLF